MRTNEVSESESTLSTGQLMKPRHSNSGGITFTIRIKATKEKKDDVADLRAGIHLCDSGTFLGNVERVAGVQLLFSLGNESSRQRILGITGSRPRHMCCSSQYGLFTALWRHEGWFGLFHILRADLMYDSASKGIR